jgi:8-oxo-dGTP pyrophosphatase MutT (NUDIX family)
VPGANLLADVLADVLSRRSPTTLDNGKRSAVMLLLHDRDGLAHLILTKRSDSVGHHQGQVCLPGGRFEDDDETLLATALRETEEELGFSPRDIRVVGALDEVHTRQSGFAITPFVGLREFASEPIPNLAEVARVIEVPVADLLAADSMLPRHPTVETLRYPLLGEDVWGATARILRGFCDHVRVALRV